jgi:hypothetical protein
MRYILSILLALAPLSCERTSAPAVVESAAAHEAVAGALLQDVDKRKTWPVRSVKFHASQPELRVQLKSSAGEAVELHAWRHNDFDTPMMRLNSGDVLYALTESEFASLRAVAALQAPSGVTN